MSTSCNGEVVREGGSWHCLSCGHTSTAWNTQHARLLSPRQLFTECLRELVLEAEQAENVEAA